AGRQDGQPHEVFQPSSCITAGTDFSVFDRMKPRTSSWVRSMHLHIGLRPPEAYLSPSVALSSASTLVVHWPHEDDALVWARTSSSVTRPRPVIACVIVPLQTPLQPQISASSDSAATAATGSSGAPPP